MAEVYLKIYVKEVYGEGMAVIFEGCGGEEKDGYYPTGKNDKFFRNDNVVVGEEHMLISKEAKEGIKYICKHSKNYDDDFPWFDIDLWYGNKPDAIYDVNWRREHEPQVRIVYGGGYIDRLSLSHVITSIGHYRRKPMLELLDRIPLADNSELAAGYDDAMYRMQVDIIGEEEIEKMRRKTDEWLASGSDD